MRVIQLLDSRMDNFSYIIYDPSTRDAAIIDPSFDANKILREIGVKKLNTKYIILTHEHLDHIHCLKELKNKTKAKVCAHTNSKIDADIHLKDNDVIKTGNDELSIIHTPGHTPESICILAENKLFTGDTIFVGCCGRTDLSGGNEKDLKSSIEKIKKLPNNTIIFPGHDYGKTKASTIGKEKRNNPFFA